MLLFLFGSFFRLIDSAVMEGGGGGNLETEQIKRLSTFNHLHTKHVLELFGINTFLI